MKKVFVINGSASEGSSNQKLIDYFIHATTGFFSSTVFNELKTLPLFDPNLSAEHAPKAILNFRQSIETADAILICTPEYIFSIPSGLKNAIEWCVATTAFAGKPIGLITASASGEKAHEELQLIMKTLMAKFTAETTLLIKGIKGKIKEKGDLTDSKTKAELSNFIVEFKKLIANSSS